jgi:hypothetical protein
MKLLASHILEDSVDGPRMELAQDRVQWRALILAVLNLPVLLPEFVN